MCVCGLVHPITSAIYGGLWVFGRFIYGFGYATGGPKGRMAGGIISHLGDFPLMGLTFVLAYRLLTAA